MNATATGSDEFRYLAISDPDTLDPAVDYETTGTEIIQNVYETLVWYDGGTSDLVPVLALDVPSVDNGGISADGLVYTFHIRPDVTFQDGTYLDAFDVEYSLERVLLINDLNSPAWLLGEWIIPNYYDSRTLDPSVVEDAIQVIDSMTVQIHLVSPFGGFLQILACPVCSIISMEYVEANGGVVQGERSEHMASHMCGTGPYLLEDWVPGVYRSLARFEDHWSGPAPLAHIQIDIVNDDYTRAMMLIYGEADYAYTPAYMKDTLAGQPGVADHSGELAYWVNAVGLNQAIAPSDLDIGTIGQDFFSDQNVRLAFAYAFDTQSAISLAFSDNSVPLNSIIPYGILGNPGGSVPRSFDLSIASSYLAAAIDPNTGVDWASQGFTLNLYYNLGNYQRETVYNILKQGVESLGTDGNIIVNVIGLEWPTYVSHVADHSLPSYCVGWAADYADPNAFLQPFLHSQGWIAQRVSLSDMGLDASILACAAELNPTVREIMVSDLATAVESQAYYIGEMQQRSICFMSSVISGYVYNPMHAGLIFEQFSKTTAPGPVNFFHAQVGDEAAWLKWVAPFVNSDIVTGYNIFRSTDQSDPDPELLTFTTGTSYLDLGLTNDVTYYYWIEATSPEGPGERSGPYDVTPRLGASPDYLTIFGDTDLLTYQQLYKWPGTGSSEDPIVVSGLSIYWGGLGAHGQGIIIHDTTLCVRIERSLVEMAYQNGGGVELFNCYGIELRECTVLGTVGVGYSTGVSIIDCQIVPRGNDVGLYMGDCTQCSVVGCQVSSAGTRAMMTVYDRECLFQDNSVVGAYSDFSGTWAFIGEDCIIADNQVKGGPFYNYDGTLLPGSVAMNLLAEDCVLTGNEFIEGSLLLDMSYYGVDLGSNSIDQTNTVNGRPICFYHDQDLAAVTIPKNAGEVILWNSPHAKLDGIKVADVFSLLLAYGSDDVSMSNCEVNNATCGLAYMFDCDRLLFVKNKCRDAYLGMAVLAYWEEVTGATIQKNTFIDNAIAIELYFVNGATIDSNAMVGVGTGVMMYGSDNLIVANTIDAEFGVFISGDRNVVTKNSITVTMTGVSIGGYDNVISKNKIIGAQTPIDVWEGTCLITGNKVVVKGK